MHAAAFCKIASFIAASNLQSFAANSLKVLWLGDSATCLLLALAFGYLAVRPFSASRWIIVLLVLIPAVTAVLIYIFIGSFIGGHILIAAALAGFTGAVQLPRSTLGVSDRTPNA